MLLAQAIFPGYVRVEGLVQAAVFALILGLLNALVRPILLLLTCPLTLATLGLFVFIVNATMFWLATWVTGGVEVSGFVGALLGSIVVSICSTVASRFIE